MPKPTVVEGWAHVTPSGKVKLDTFKRNKRSAWIAAHIPWRRKHPNIQPVRVTMEVINDAQAG